MTHAEPAPVGISIGLRARDVAATIRALKRGLPFSSVERLKDRLAVSTGELAAAINVSPRTLARRKREGRLRTDESERLLRIGVLFDRTEQVLGGDDEARRWLKAGKKALGGRSPLEFADTEPGAREVQDLLGRIEHGVFS